MDVAPSALGGLDGWDGSPGGVRYRAPYYGANKCILYDAVTVFCVFERM